MEITTLRSFDELVGTLVRTDQGMHMVWEYSIQRETFLVGATRETAVDRYVEHLRQAPMPEDPADLPQWLEKPTWAFVEPGYTPISDCACGCNACQKGNLHTVRAEGLCQCQQKDCSCL